MGAQTVKLMEKVICETTAEQYMVEVSGPKIEKMEKTIQKTQEDVKNALDRPLTLGEEAISSFISKIEGPVKRIITQTKCALPDTESFEIRIADAVRDAAKAGIAAATLKIEVHHSVRLEEDTKERMERNERRLESICKSFHVKPLEFWERLLLKVETGIIAAAILTAAICIPAHQKSAEHWGMRYYRVCNDPRQNDEQLLSRKETAFSDVVESFRQGNESRRQMKAFIRENEQRLNRLRAKR